MKYTTSLRASLAQLQAIWQVLNPTANISSIAKGRTTQATLEEWWDRFHQFSFVVVAQDDERSGEPVGVLRVSKLPGGEVGQLRELACARRYQGKTVGEQTLEKGLVDKAVGHARRERLKVLRFTMTASTLQSHVDAVKAAGFQKIEDKGWYELQL